MAKNNSVYREKYHQPLEELRQRNVGLTRALDETLLPSNAMHVLKNIQGIESGENKEAANLLESLSNLSKVRYNRNRKPI